MKTSIKYNLWAIAKAKASVKGKIAFYTGFLYIQNKIAHSQKKKSFATIQAKEVKQICNLKYHMGIANMNDELSSTV